MMRLAYIEATFGLSGDKILSALLDAGADADGLRAALDSMDIGIGIETATASAGSIAARRTTVTTSGEQTPRTWRDIETLIRDSSLEKRVIEDSLDVFERIANTEAAVHGVEPADVHFHEVGAADSIGDIVGCVWCLHDLGIEYIACSEVVTGSGTVETQHGRLPVPAPATSLLLVGVPTRGGDEPFEMTTPTGAAIVATLADWFGPPPAMTVTSIGVGVGTHESTVPNICRVFVGDAESAEDTRSDIESQAVVLLATTLDDITPEHLVFAVEELLGAGALDVWRSEVAMKKGRAGTTLEVLARPEDAERLSSLTMKLTGSPGVRMSVLSRRVAPREIIEVESEWGPARVKVARVPGRVVTHAEYDDCSRIAREHGLAPEDVARTLEGLARSKVASDSA